MEKERPIYKFKGIPDPFWLSGFTSGEGSFHIVTRNLKPENKAEIFARFSIHLHIRDLEVLKCINSYFSSSQVIGSRVYIQEKSAQLQIKKFSDINNIIIPFFEKYPILGCKSLDFVDFKEICEILKTKNPLNSLTVIKKILQIKSGMNLNRKW